MTQFIARVAFPVLYVLALWDTVRRSRQSCWMGTEHSASAGLSPSLKLSKPLSELTGGYCTVAYRWGCPRSAEHQAEQYTDTTSFLPAMQLMRCVQQPLLPSRHCLQADLQYSS